MVSYRYRADRTPNTIWTINQLFNGGSPTAWYNTVDNDVNSVTSSSFLPGTQFSNIQTVGLSHIFSTLQNPSSVTAYNCGDFVFTSVPTAIFRNGTITIQYFIVGQYWFVPHVYLELYATGIMNPVFTQEVTQTSSITFMTPFVSSISSSISFDFTVTWTWNNGIDPPKSKNYSTPILVQTFLCAPITFGFESVSYTNNQYYPSQALVTCNPG
jgi:hypothetical protein